MSNNKVNKEVATRFVYKNIKTLTLIVNKTNKNK